MRNNLGMWGPVVLLEHCYLIEVIVKGKVGRVSRDQIIDVKCHTKEFIFYILYLRAIKRL